MKFVKLLTMGILVIGLAACAKSTKTIFGKPGKGNVADSSQTFVLPSDLRSNNVHELYPVYGDVPAQQPEISLVPPGSNLGIYVKQR
jgi:hypothetical protein